jgi:signal transduction histidine kinase
MRRKITLSLFALFIFFASGTILATLYIKKTTTDFSRVIKLHQIEDLRQNLVMSIQTTQSDLYTVHTSLGQELDSIVRNVTNLEQAAQKCSTCHHSPELTKRLNNIQSLVHDYDNALNIYITASTNTEGTEKLQRDTAALGNKILADAEEMSIQASNHLEVITSSAMLRIEKARRILYITIFFTFFLGIIIAVWLTISITKPARELVNATRVIASGDLGYTVSYKDKTEFGEIATNFNEMSVALKKGNEELKEEITMRKQVEEELKDSHEQLRNLSMYLLDVREEERTNVAREIHDELGQRLTAMKMDVSWLSKRLSKDQESLLEKAQSITKSIHTTIHTVKKISSNLRPSVLDHFGLSAAIEWEAKEFGNRTDIPCNITIVPEDIILDKDLSTSIFRIFQETLTNVIRHAKATRVDMSLKEEAEKIVLEVIDNGKGITKEQVSSPISFGLIGIKERVKALRGEVTIRGIPKQGTTVTITIPLNNNESID